MRNGTRKASITSIRDRLVFFALRDVNQGKEIRLRRYKRLAGKILLSPNSMVAGKSLFYWDCPSVWFTARVTFFDILWFIYSGSWIIGTEESLYISFCCHDDPQQRLLGLRMTSLKKQSFIWASYVHRTNSLQDQQRFSLLKTCFFETQRCSAATDKPSLVLPMAAWLRCSCSYYLNDFRFPVFLYES